MYNTARWVLLGATTFSAALETGCDSTTDTDSGGRATMAGASVSAATGGAATRGDGVGGAAVGGGAPASSAGAGAAGAGGLGGASTSGAGGTGTAGAVGVNASGASGAGAGTANGGAGASSAGTPGTSGAGTNAGGTGTSSDGFTLAWQDDFDTLDTTRWQLQTFSFDGNLAQFSTDNASVTNGILSIALTPEPSDTAKPYRGVELRSVPTVTFGKVEARARFAKGSGVVSGLVLIYTPWPADNWNEIDIEHLGKTSAGVQLNCQVYTGPPTTPPVTESVMPTQDPELETLGFDAEADFHVYAMEWTPTAVRFTADGTVLRTWTKEIARMTLPQNILFTIWASSAADWAGALASDSAPTTADIDWIKVYTYDE